MRSAITAFILILSVLGVASASAQNGGTATKSEVERLWQQALAEERGGKTAEAEATFKIAIGAAEKNEATAEKGELPSAWLALAYYHRRRNDWDAALQEAQRAVRLSEERLAPVDQRIAKAHGLLGYYAVLAGRYAQAEVDLRWVLEAYQRAPDSVGLREAAAAAENLAVAQQRQGRLPEAILSQKQSVAWSALVQPRDERALAKGWHYLASLQESQKNWSDAEVSLIAAIAAAERMNAPLDDTLPIMLLAQANLQRLHGKVDKAHEAAMRAAELRTAALGAEHPSTLEARVGLGHIALQMSNRAEADAEYAAVVSIWRRAPNKSFARLAGIAGCELGKSQRIQKRSADALPNLLAGIEAYEAAARAGDTDAVAFCYRMLGLTYIELDKFSAAEAPLRKSLDLYEKLGKGDEADVGNVYVGLAWSLFEIGRYRDAEQASRRAVELFSKSGDRLKTTSAQMHLVKALRYLRRLPESEALAREVLAVREEKLQPDDPLIGETSFALAAALRWQSKNAEAEPLYRRALAIREKAYGPDSQHALADRYGLAMAIDGLGRATEAEGLLRQLLADRERALGPVNVDVGDTLVSLVWNLRRQGRLDEAVPFAERALAVYRKALSRNHPTTVSGLLALAAVRKDRGENDEAERLYQEGLRIRIEVYGPDSINAGESYGDMMMLAIARRQFEEAEAWSAKRLVIYEKWFGADDPQIVGALADLQVLKAFNGDADTVESLGRRILEIVERVYGPESLAAAVAASNVVYAYRLRGKLGNIEALYERPLAIYRRVLGPRHPWVASALCNLADVRVSLGQADEALALNDEAASIFAERYGKDSPVLSTPFTNKALLLMQLGRMEEAERLLRRSIELLRQGSGSSTSWIATVLINLSFVLDATGQHAEAEKSRQEAVDVLSRLYGPGRLPPLVMAPLLPPSPKEL